MTLLSPGRGPDAFIECTMADGGKILARCLMIVAYVDKQTTRGAHWPAEVMELFFELEPKGT